MIAAVLYVGNLHPTLTSPKKGSGQVYLNRKCPVLKSSIASTEFLWFFFFIKNVCKDLNSLLFAKALNNSKKGVALNNLTTKSKVTHPPNPQDRLAFVLQIISCYQGDLAFTMNAKFQSKQKFEAG